MQPIHGRSHARHSQLQAIHCAIERQDAQRSVGAPLSSPEAAQRCAEGAGLDSGDPGRSTIGHAVDRAPLQRHPLQTISTNAAAPQPPQLQSRISTSLTDVTRRRARNRSACIKFGKQLDLMKQTRCKIKSENKTFQNRRPGLLSMTLTMKRIRFVRQPGPDAPAVTPGGDRQPRRRRSIGRTNTALGSITCLSTSKDRGWRTSCRRSSTFDLDELRAIDPRAATAATDRAITLDS
jgi:hypothetical protein